MFGIIIGTHGDLANGFAKVAQMITGEQKCIETVSVREGEGPLDILKKYEASIEALKERGFAEKIIFLNDLFGGSPYNAACRLVAKNDHYAILTGVNLPMLLELLNEEMNEGLPIRELVDKARDIGEMGVQVFYKDLAE